MNKIAKSYRKEDKIKLPAFVGWFGRFCLTLLIIEGGTSAIVCLCSSQGTWKHVAGLAFGTALLGSWIGMLLTHIRRGVMPYYVTWGRRYRHYGRGERILYYGGGIFFLWWIGSMMCATVVCEAGWPPPSYFWTLLLWPLALLEKLHHYVIS